MTPATRGPFWGWDGSSREVLGLVALLLSLGVLTPSGVVGTPRTALDPRLVIDPNTDPAPVLGALPGIGPSRALAIVAARREAPFRDAQDMERRVLGIGPATLDVLRPHLRFEPPDTARERERERERRDANSTAPR